MQSLDSLNKSQVDVPARSQTYYGLIVWLLGASFFYYKYLLQVSFSVMTTELMQTFQISAAGLGYLDAFYFWTYLLMQIPVGILLDYFSPRKLTTLAILLSAGGALLFSCVQSFYMACLARAIIGFGVSFAAVSGLKMIAIWFKPKHFPLMAGLLMTAAMLGAMTANYPLALLIEWVGSWRLAMVVLATFGLLLGLIYFLIVRDGMNVSPDQSKPKRSLREEYFGFRGLREVLANKQTWLLSLYSGFAFAPVSVFGGLWGVPFLMTAHQIDKSTAAAETMIIFIGFGVGCPLGGWLVSKLKRSRWVMGVGTAIALATFLPVIYWMHYDALTLRGLLFLFGGGASFFMASFAVIKQVNRLALAATAIGFMNMFQSAVEAISMPLIGILLDWGWHGELNQGIRVYNIETYHWALSLFPIYFILALILLSFVRETFLTQKV